MKLKNISILLALSFSLFFCTKFELPPLQQNKNLTQISPNSSFVITNKKLAQNLTAASVTNDGYVINNSSNTINVWDYQKDILIHSFDNTSPVKALALSQDEKLLYTGSTDSKIRIFDWKTGKLVSFFTGVTEVKSMRISPDGKYLATLESGSSSNNVHIWNIENNQLINVLTVGSTLNIHDIAVSKDGEYVAVSGYHFLKVWSTKTTELVSDLSTNTTYFGDIAFGIDGKTLINNQFEVYLTFTGVKVYNFLTKNVIGAYSINYLKSGNGIDLSADGRYCYTGQVLLDLQNKSILWQTLPEQYQETCAISPNGAYMINYDENGRINLFDKQGKMINVTTNQLNKIPNESTSYKENLYILAANELLVVSFSGQNPSHFYSPNGISFFENIACSNDFIYAKNCGDLYFWNLTRNSIDKTIRLRDVNSKNNGYCNTNLTLSPNKDMIAAQSINNLGNIYIYNAQSGFLLNQLTELAPGTHQNFVFTNDNKYILGINSNKDAINVWNVQTGKIETRIKSNDSGDYPPNIAIDPTDKVLAIFGSLGLNLYSFPSGELIETLAIIRHTNNIYNSYFDYLGHIKFSPDGLFIAAASGNTVYIITTNNGLMSSYSNLDSGIVGIEFNETSSILAVITKTKVATFNLSNLK